MKLLSYTNLHNFIWFQSIWFIAIFAGVDVLWLSIIALAIAAHFYWVDNGYRELKTILACSAVGISVDSVLAVTDVFEFSSHTGWFPIPLWLVAIWIAFTGTLNKSLQYLVKKPILMTVLAGVSAPLSYIAAARVGVVNFPLGYINTFLIVGATWVLMVPIFYLVQRKIDEKALIGSGWE